MTRPGGFALLEVLVALLITSVVALLAYGTASTGFDLSERLERHRTTVEAQVIVRALLVDALRHPVEGGGAAMNDMLLTIDDRSTANGVPFDGLHFLTRGVIPPLGATTTWSVTLTPSEQGLRLLAAPLETNDAATSQIDALIPSVYGLRVRALARTADSVWSDHWEVPGRLPAAVWIDFLSARAVPVAPPLVVHAALEVVR